MDAPKLIENLFYTMTIVSTFTCVIRSDYNFAFALLSYYMIKTSKDQIKTARPVSGIILSEFIASVNKRRTDIVRHPLVHHDEQCLVGQANHSR